MVTPWVVDLRDPDAGRTDLVGAKAAHLHRLAAAGMPVPDAFVITTAAFGAHFPSASAVASGFEAPPAASKAPPAASKPPPAAMKWQPPLHEAVDQHLQATFGGAECYLAVRSSALGEDSDTASFAGQHDTYYYIKPEGLTAAVEACWRSLWSDRAISYRQARAVDAPFSMAVIVQRMIQADRSGVCFTRDPTAEGGELGCIEAIWGLGAALVDGRVSPDRLLMARSGEIRRQHVARKRWKVAQALTDPGGPRLDPVPVFQQAAAVLSPSDAALVLEWSLRAEALFGCPQDVEWAFQGNVLHLLQSRPISVPTPAALTVAPETPGAPSPASRAWVLFKPLAENFTDPMTPMTADLMRRLAPPGTRFFDGRLYLSLDLAARLCPFRWSHDTLANVMLLRGGAPDLKLRWSRVPLVLAAISGGYLFDGINWHRSAHLNPQALTRFQWLCDRLRNDGDRSALSAFVRLVLGRHPFEPIGHQAFYLNVSAGRYFLLLGALKALARRYAPEFDQYRISELCVGDGETWSRRLVEEVRQLAQVAAEDPALAARLTGDDDAAITDVLTGLADEHPFALAFSQFMDRFGHRCAREMELSTPRWREDPLAVMLMVRNYLTAPPAAFRDRHASFLAARNELREALPRAWQRRLAGYLTGRIRYYVSLRENTRHFHSMAMDVTRQKLLALEGRLMARQRLRAAGDVFYLTWGEAAALEAGNLQWSDVAEPIRRRRRQRRLSGRNPVRETLNLDSPVAPGPESASGPEGAILRGQCASPGVAEGRVRIVLDPSSVSRLVPGDVLVAPFTDPAWTPLFPLAAAVVVEVGSYLSHAGTLAREYGIPCLVDVRHCTRRLREGQRVRVNASDGTVTMLEQD